MPKRSASNITMEAAETAPPGLLWDRETPGFGLRTLPTGARTWLFKYRSPDGRQHWHRIGTFPAMAVKEARKKARSLRAAVDDGRDPSKDREAEREAERAARAAPVELLAESYAKALPGRPSLRGSGAISAAHAAAEADAVKRAIARMDLEGRPVSEVTATDLLGLLRLEASRPATARMMFSAFGRFMEWCREGKHISANPCDAVPRAKRPKPPPARRRVVALADLARIWRAAGVLPAPLGDLARLLVAVPVRRGEAARLAWQDVNLAEGVWTLPGAITKNGDQHSITLPPLALRLLRLRHKAMGHPATGLAFPSPRANKPVMAWTAMKAEISTAVRFTAWTWHDFRRSFASLMAERGVAEPVADAVLNHRQSSTRGGVLGVYQHAQRRPEQEAAMRAWGVALAAAIKADAELHKGKARATRDSIGATADGGHIGMSDMAPPATADLRAAEVERAAALIAGMPADAEARRDTAFACLAELLRLGRADLAQATVYAIRGRLPDDPESAFMPPDPPPLVSPATCLAFDDEEAGPVWPWAGLDFARRVGSGPDLCAGIGASLWRDGTSDGWEWVELGAIHANRASPGGQRQPSCEPLGTFLAWLVVGQHRQLGRSAIPKALRHVWPSSYPEARWFCRPGPDGRSPADTARAAAALVEAAGAQFRERAARLDQPARNAGEGEPPGS